ncbi:MAG: hypothetical protein HQL34_10065 [Alphaproteobacteria bacterium]|nr:hypothetical protein [Alphaproteobacteria bacterium]
MKPNLTDQGRTIRVHVPMELKRRGGRKLIIAPDGATDWAAPQPRIDDTLIKALARAWRWRGMIETGKVRTVRHLAEKEKISSSYLARILRLTLLAPDIIEAILDGRAPKGLSLADLMEPFPMEWEQQRARFWFVKPKQ